MFAQETVNGEKWGTHGRAYGKGYTSIHIGGDLQKIVRAWLFAQVSAGKMQVHNFGKGHISGARFRPNGAPLAPSEKETFERKAKEKTRTTPKPVHFALHGGAGCTQIKKPSRFGRSSRSTRTTSDLDKVTCPRCIKLRGEFETVIAKKKAMQVAYNESRVANGTFVKIDDADIAILRASVVQGGLTHRIPETASKEEIVAGLKDLEFAYISVLNKDYIHPVEE